MVGNEEIQDGVTEEFKSLIGIPTFAKIRQIGAMEKGLYEEGPIAGCVADHSRELRKWKFSPSRRDELLGELVNPLIVLVSPEEPPEELRKHATREKELLIAYRPRYSWYFLMRREALCPPNPKVLLIAASMCRS